MKISHAYCRQSNYICNFCGSIGFTYSKCNLCVLIFFRVDVVFLSGDIANVPVETAANGGPAEVFEEHHCHLKKIVEEFSSTCVKVYYLPGNVSSVHVHHICTPVWMSGHKSVHNANCFITQYFVY